MTTLKHKLAGFLVGVLVASGIVSAQTGIMSTTTGVVYVRGISGVTLTNSTFTGQSKFADGSAAAPSITFASDTDTGFFRPGGGQIDFSSDGATRIRFSASRIQMRGDMPLAWESGAIDSGLDLYLYRDAANTLAQRNGTSAQAFRVYNTYTDASNFEWGGFRWNSNQFQILTQASGTGTVRDIVLLPGSGGSLVLGGAAASRWVVNTSGHFVGAVDNTYDIGASGATRPRNIYAGGTITAGGRISTPSDAVIDQNITLGTTYALLIGSRGGLSAPADGVFALKDNAGTSFSRLQFGGTTNLFPAWKRQNANISAVLADDSNFTGVYAEHFRLANSAVTWTGGTGSPEGVVTANIGALYSRTDGGAGTSFYVKESGTGNTGWVAK